MKMIPVLVTVIALACGSAMAAGSKAGAAGADLSHGNAVSTEHTTSSGQPREGMVNKMKRGMHRMGEATRNAMHRMGRKDAGRTEQAAGSDTRSMGAAGSGPQDSARRSRMDQAYEDWKSKQK